MDLWTESDDHEIASAPFEQARVGTRPIASTNTVLPALRAWLLSDYAAPYCRSLAAARIFRRCFWIDAPGEMRHTTKKNVGTRFVASTNPTHQLDATLQFDPVLQPDATPQHADALQPLVALAAELARESKPIMLQGIALTGNKSGRKQEHELEEKFVLPKASSIVNAAWREVAPALLPAIEQSAALFLLNPLAVAKPSSSNLKGRGRPQGSKVPAPLHSTAPALTKNEIPFLTGDELAPLLQRTAPTELCLLLMHRQVETILLPALRTTAGAAAFTMLLRSDRWKALLAQESGNTPTMASVDKVIDLFLAALQPHFLFVRRLAFPMSIGPATVEDAPCTLIFATRRQDSLACMNDAACGYRRRLEEESRRGLLNEAWFAAQQAERNAQAMQRLREETLRIGRAQSPRRWPDLRQQLLLAHFGQWMLREYDEVICHLLQAGEARCEWRQPGAQVGAEATDAGNHALRRVPGNEDIMLWQEKKKWMR